MGTASRWSTWTFPPEPCRLTEAITPPTWSPGVALNGTVTVNGSFTRSPGLIVMVFFGMATHEPTSFGDSEAASRSREPDVVLNASDAYTSKVTGFWLKFVTPT